jgi:transcriptional regulator with XRE-family HTH domain
MIFKVDRMTDELRDWLEAQLKERRLSQNALAKETGIGVATVNNIVKYGHTPGAGILNKLAEYFNVQPEFVYRLAGHLPLAGEEPSPDPDALRAANMIMEVKGKPTMYTLPDPSDYLANDFWRIWQDLPETERVKLIRMAESMAEEREQMGESVGVDKDEESLGDVSALSS